jgi:hypothetical protein
MQTLSYGYKKPDKGDKGSVFFPALEDNITLVNNHSHNGTNSAKLDSNALSLTTQALASVNWVLVGGGTYRQAVVIPNGMLWDNKILLFRDSVTYEQLYLSTENISTTQYYVYINDNTKSLIVTYL